MDNNYLKQAIELSKESVLKGGYPVGAIIHINGEIYTGLSNGKVLHDATSHAEICALRDASSELRQRDLKGAIVYSSMEPCLMCFSACYWAGVSKIVFACSKNILGVKHFEGNNDLEVINKKNNQQIEILHIVELQSEALEVITNWESSLT